MLPHVAGLASEVPPLTRRARSLGYEARILWVDASANWEWLVNAGKIEEFCSQAKRAGFSELVFDLKPIVGYPLYPSTQKPPLEVWKGIAKPSGMDILGVFIAAAQARGLRVSVSVNTFSEGHGYFERAGLIWAHPEWASTAVVWDWTATRGTERIERLPLNPKRRPVGPALFTRAGRAALAGFGPPIEHLGVRRDGTIETGDNWEYLLATWNEKGLPPEFVEATDPIRFESTARLDPVTNHATEYTALFVSPLHPEVRRLQIETLKEVAQKYPIDGIYFDRMRYEGLTNDYGPLMREAFASRYGSTGRWPESVLAPPDHPGGEPKRGLRWAEFQELRASIVRDFYLKARKELRAAGVTVPIGAYVGAWYDAYEDVGVNWAGDQMPTQYPWAEAAYRFTGYAGAMDMLCVGSYYPLAEPEENPLNPLLTVGGACDRAVEVAGGSTFVYGSLYLLDYKDAEGLTKAIRAARKHSLGIMVFDASYILKNGWWGVFTEALTDAPARAPHWQPSLLSSLRASP